MNRPLILLLPLLLACAQAQANSLPELRAQLAKQAAVAAPLKAQVELKSLNRIGEGKDLEETVGEVAASVEDGPQGLRFALGREAVQRAERDELARAADPKAKTPTLTALRELTPMKLHDLASPAARFGRLLDRAKPTGQKAEDWNGKPATRLSFELERAKAAGREAEFIKEYKGTLEVWVAADGTPLAAKARHVFGGRAYVFFTFENVQENEYLFGLAGERGERLVLLKSEERNTGSGTAGKTEMRTSWVLKPAS